VGLRLPFRVDDRSQNQEAGKWLMKMPDLVSTRDELLEGALMDSGISIPGTSSGPYPAISDTVSPTLAGTRDHSANQKSVS